MNKIIVPPTLFKGSFGKLALKDDINKDVLTSIFNKENCDFVLNVPNKRNWYTICSDTLLDLQDTKNLEINCNNIDSLQVKALFFDWNRYHQDPQKGGYTYIPMKSLKISNKNFLYFEMSSDRKMVEKFNLSPLEDLALSSNQVDLRINNFKELKKIKIEAKTLAKLKLDDCEKLKEIDLTKITNMDRYFEFKLNNIPDDCIIKVNKNLIDKINFIDSRNFKVGKKMLNVRFYQDQQEHYEGEWIYWERYNLSKLKENISDSEIMTFNFKDLKVLFKAFSSSKEAKETKSRVEKSKEDAQKRRDEYLSRF